jgi:hypothetical protein
MVKERLAYHGIKSADPFGILWIWTWLCYVIIRYCRRRVIETGSENFSE